MNAPQRPRRMNSPLSAFIAAERIVALKEGEKARLEQAAKNVRQATIEDIDFLLSRVEEDERPRVVVLVETALRDTMGNLAAESTARRMEHRDPATGLVSTPVGDDDEAPDVEGIAPEAVRPWLAQPKPEEPPGSRIETEERPRRRGGRRA